MSPLPPGRLKQGLPDEHIRLVYVADDEGIVQATVGFLKQHSMEVTRLNSGKDAVKAIAALCPQAVLIELGLAAALALEICRDLREFTDVPILILSGLSGENVMVRSLEMGADDYVVRPCPPGELVARIRAQVRRSLGRLRRASMKLSVGPLLIDSEARSAFLLGKELVLTSREFALLHVLAQRAGQVMTREYILEALHGTADEVFDRAIDVQISRLRQKLGDNPRSPALIKTVRGVGYLLAYT